ncbi:uncharacterized protein LOC135169312 [Diachasmimorpha longicaudata]|uniref:uncharacterized protein LOC135169312 n=1 Tax=Diachasmimorpha longicaudata TaxID=58733 RepID=UPI0030B86A4D
MVHCVIIFISVVFLYAPCNAIQCYQCDNLKDINCTEKEVDPRHLQYCPNTHNYCRKIISMFYFKDPNEPFVVRECAVHGPEENVCYKGKYSKDSYQYICECKNAEGCNSSSTPDNQNWVLLSPIIFTFFHLKN